MPHRQAAQRSACRDNVTAALVLSLASFTTAIGSTMAVATPAYAQMGCADLSLCPSLWTVDSLKSDILGETRTFRISLPRRYNWAVGSREGFPVLILLETPPGDLFASIIANASVLAEPAGPAIPEVIIVAVDLRRRIRDMSPPPRGGEDRPDGGWGGAPAYAQFLERELLPFIAARYRTLPFTVLAGHSLSGLFAVYAYANHSDFVNAAIGISPTLIWSDTTVRDIADAVRARDKRGRLFVATGVSEIDLDSAAARLATNLTDRPNRLTVFEHRRLAEDWHFTSTMQGMIDGLRFIFRPIQLSNYRFGLTLQERDSRADSVGRAVLGRYQEARRQYIEGARELGLPEKLPAAFGGGLGGQLAANAGQASAAKVICEDILAEHPESWIGYDCMGAAKRYLNDIAGAAEAYRTGLAVAERAGDTRAVERMKRALEGLQRRSP